MKQLRLRISAEEAIQNGQRALLAIAQGLIGIEIAAQVEVCSSYKAGMVTFRLNVPEQTAGKVIGRSGRTARALRIVLAAMGNEVGQTWSLDVAVGSEKALPCPPIEQC